MAENLAKSRQFRVKLLRIPVTRAHRYTFWSISQFFGAFDGGVDRLGGEPEPAGGLPDGASALQATNFCYLTK